MKRLLHAFAGLSALAAVASAPATPLFENGFETDIAGWDAFGGGFDATRVASGTSGIISAGGAFHGESAGGGPNATGSAGNWGGYNFGAGGAVPTTFTSYRTALDVFLDVDAGFANDTRFDFSSAINNADGNFLRDFVFNGGFYSDSDSTGPGAGSNRFVFSASNNATRSSAFPKNPGRDPFAVGETGWYTFEHLFYESGGFLAADLAIYDDLGNLLNTWTLGGDTDAIGDVGGNRYGWFALQELSVLAFDNTLLEVVEAEAQVAEPATFALLAGSLGLLGWRRRRA